MSYNTESLIFLNRFKPTGSEGRFELSLFFNEEGQILPPIDTTDPKYAKNLTNEFVLGYFNENDYPDGENQMIISKFDSMFKTIPSAMGIVLEYETPNLYYLNLAPKKGWYVSTIITLNKKDTINNSDVIYGSEITVSLNQEESIHLTPHEYDIDIQVVEAQYLEEPENVSTTDEEKFNIQDWVIQPDNLKIIAEWIESYYLLLPFNYNRETVESALLGKN